MTDMENGWIIRVETKDESPRVFYWNRRKSVWQENLSNGCFYPTRMGSQRVWKSICFRDWPYIESRPVRSVEHKFWRDSK